MAAPLFTGPRLTFQAAISESVQDSVSGEYMTTAVTLIPCGHTFNKETIDRLAHNGICPLDRSRIKGYVPNYTIRQIADIVSSQPSEEGSLEVRAPLTITSNSRENLKESYKNLLFRLLEEPPIQAHSDLSSLLKSHLDQLMAEEAEELTKAQKETYRWTQKILIDQKINAYTLEKLQQMRTSSTSSIKPPLSIASASTVPDIAFGATEWRYYFGDVGVEPPLPRDINAILHSPCPFWPDKKVEETHLLVLIPATVNGSRLTFQLLGDLVQGLNRRNPAKYGLIDLGEYREIPLSESRWTLLTRHILPESRHMSYSDQQALITQYNKKSRTAYEVPHVLDTSVCLFVEYIRRGIFLYGGEPWTFTRCQEKYSKDQQLVVGGFSLTGLRIFDDRWPHTCGVGALQKL